MPRMSRGGEHKTHIVEKQIRLDSDFIVELTAVGSNRLIGGVRGHGVQFAQKNFQPVHQSSYQSRLQVI